LHTLTSRLPRSHAVLVVDELATANMHGNDHLAAAIADQA
jgi:hypothetical protein